MATDFFLTIDGVRGDSKDAAYPNAIIVKSWSYGATSPVDFTTKQALGQAQLSDLSITKGLDRSSPTLIQMLVQNKTAKTVELTCRKAGDGQKPYFKITLKSARVRSIKTQVLSESEEPVEVVTFSYQRINWSVKTQDDRGGMSGAAEFEHDLTRNL